MGSASFQHEFQPLTLIPIICQCMFFEPADSLRVVCDCGSPPASLNTRSDRVLPTCRYLKPMCDCGSPPASVYDTAQGFLLTANAAATLKFRLKKIRTRSSFNRYLVPPALSAATASLYRRWSVSGPAYLWHLGAVWKFIVTLLRLAVLLPPSCSWTATVHITLVSEGWTPSLTNCRITAHPQQ